MTSNNNADANTTATNSNRQQRQRHRYQRRTERRLAATRVTANQHRSENDNNQDPDNKHHAVTTTNPNPDGNTNSTRKTNRRRGQQQRAQKAKGEINTLVFNPVFVFFTGMLVISCLLSFLLVFLHPEVLAERDNAEGSTGAGTILQDNQDHDRTQRGGGASSLVQMVGKEEEHFVYKQSPPLLHGELDYTDPGGRIGKKKKKKKKKTPAEEEEKKKQQQRAEVIVDKVVKKQRANHQPELTPTNYTVQPFDTSLVTPHLIPHSPPLPIFREIENQELLIQDLLHHNKPTIAGIIALLQHYIHKLHAMHKRNSALQHTTKTGAQVDEHFLIDAYFNLTRHELDPFEEAYRGRTIFPVRENEDSIFMSLAAFRETLLAQTLMSAFRQATHPEKLYVGIVVQNCFGGNGTICHTGIEVIGTNDHGQPITSISPQPPDVNGVEEFCHHPDFKHYCATGHLRVVYVHDTDALGPATARYYASKLWGGETYYLQMDAHLEFAPAWDQYYRDEVRACRSSAPPHHVVLSAYPPGFQEYDGAYAGGTPGARLCHCEFSDSDVEDHILRIGMGAPTPPDATHPTQIPFIAAGFFFAHATFLRDVPFDPYVPWCFMGEEIALSVRAWTMGWNIVRGALSISIYLDRARHL